MLWEKDEDAMTKQMQKEKKEHTSFPSKKQHTLFSSGVLPPGFSSFKSQGYDVQEYTSDEEYSSDEQPQHVRSASDFSEALGRSIDAATSLQEPKEWPQV